MSKKESRKVNISYISKDYLDMLICIEKKIKKFYKNPKRTRKYVLEWMIESVYAEYCNLSTEEFYQYILSKHKKNQKLVYDDNQ